MTPSEPDHEVSSSSKRQVGVPVRIPSTERETTLKALLLADGEVRAAVEAVIDLEIPNWAVGGGVVRDVVWDFIFRNPGRTDHNDIADIEDAVSRFPETCTSVAIAGASIDTLRVLAPCGLDDLFDGVVRRNPRQVTVEYFRQRLHSKRIAARWPGISVVHG